MSYPIHLFVELDMSDAAFDGFLLIDKGSIESIFVPLSQNHRRIASHFSIHFLFPVWFLAFLLSVVMFFNTFLDVFVPILFVELELAFNSLKLALFLFCP